MGISEWGMIANDSIYARARAPSFLIIIVYAMRMMANDGILAHVKPHHFSSYKKTEVIPPPYPLPTAAV